MSLVSCAPITSGSGFLKGSLTWLDCAGQAIGSTGYIALTQPGSAVSQLILATITLFIAWQGIRMMFGRTPDMGEVVLSVAKIGLVLMLVSSWPAVRTLFADPSFSGPAELTAQAGMKGPLPLEDRLQRVDDGIVNLTKWGTGKLDIRAGMTANGQPAATEFSGIALTDNLALGLGRLCYLIGALLSIGLLKLLAGVMISALPIFAGLLLFEATRGLFWGWLRLVFALFVASFAIPLILTAELTLIEPWLAQAIVARSAYLATPSAPTELLAITGSFLLILTASIALTVKACLAANFVSVAGRVGRWRQEELVTEAASRQIAAPLASERGQLSRAESLAIMLGRSETLARNAPVLAGAGAGHVPSNDISHIDAGRGQPGGRRRARQRVALSHAKRNQL